MFPPFPSLSPLSLVNIDGVVSSNHNSMACCCPAGIPPLSLLVHRHDVVLGRQLVKELPVLQRRHQAACCHGTAGCYSGESYACMTAPSRIQHQALDVLFQSSATKASAEMMSKGRQAATHGLQIWILNAAHLGRCCLRRRADLHDKQAGLTAASDA